MHRSAVALALTAILGAGVVAGCSGDDGPGHAASTTADATKGPSMADFCAAAATLEAAGDDFGAVRSAARHWQQVGVPEDTPKNVDRGVRIGLSILRRAQGPKQVERLVDLLSPQEQDDVNAVDRYLAEECAG